MKKEIILATVSAIALMMSNQAAAQDSPSAAAPAAEEEQGGLEEIVVVAQKRAENLQRIPISIAAVTSEGLESKGIVDLQDIPAALPGVTVLAVNGVVIPRVRGVGAGFAPIGVEAPIATYVDDVYYGNSADLVFDFSDVAQLAALKGPQGTLFGRNATGGVLQITTRAPEYTTKGSIEASLDNYMTMRANMFVTGPLSDKAAASFSVAYTHQGEGYGKNLATGNDQYKVDNALTARGKLNFQPSDLTTIDFSADYTWREGPIFQNFRTFPGFSTVAPPATEGNDLWDSNRFADSTSEYRGGGLSLKLEHDLDFATFTTISAFRDSKVSFFFVNVPTPAPTTTVFASGASKQFTQEIQLVSPSDGPLTWATGAFYYYSKADIDFYVNILNPAVPVSRQSFPGTQDAYSIAGFVQATYKLADTTRLTLGFRYTYDKKNYTGNVDITPRGGATVRAFQGTEQTYSFDAPTWRIALDHDLTDRVMLYASYNRGLKSGGFNTSQPATPQNVFTTPTPPFDTERLDAYEAGIKSQLFGNRVRFNVGGFYYDYQNLQLSSFRGNQTFILNAASAEVYGIDAELEAKLSDRLSLSGGANWLHARFSDYPQGPFAVPNPGNQGATVQIRDLTGNTLPHSPNFAYTLGINYEIPTQSGTFAFNVSDSFSSGFYTEADNLLKQPSYHLLGASAKWTSNDDRYTIRVFANNILNEAVVSQGVASPNAFLADYTNPPFVFGASIKVGF